MRKNLGGLKGVFLRKEKESRGSPCIYFRNEKESQGPQVFFFPEMRKNIKGSKCLFWNEKESR